MENVNLSTRNLVRKVNKKFYYGWVILFAGALGVFFSGPGQTYSISAFIDSYIADFGFSRTVISSIYSGATLLSGCLLVFMGRFIDRFGQKKMFIVAGSMLAITCLFNSFVQNFVMIFIGFFACRYFGQGSLTLIPGTLIPQWFEKNRAFAMSIYGFGGTVGNLLIPLFNTWMISHFDWPTAWRVWAFLLAFVFVPIIWFIVVNKPEDIGLRPDNQKIEVDLAQFEADELLKDSESWQLKEALHNKVFWIIGFCSTIVPITATGLMFHFFSIMEQKQISHSQAAYIIGLIAIPGFFVPVIAGFIIDRWKSHYVLAISLGMIALDLFFFVFVRSIPAAILFILILGTAMRIQGVACDVMWPNYFGRKYLGSIRGVTTMMMVIGSSLGPIPFGLSLDLFGNYNYIFGIMGAVAVVATGLALTCRKPEKESRVSG